jgi:pimeloyl-ACP methyl ester carboxylesterase
VNAGARAALDRGLGWLAPEGQAASGTLLSVLNGLLGDHLAATANPLAIPMQLRREGEARDKAVLLIHGVCMSDRGWSRNGHDHGEALARDLGYEPLYLLYNSGRHVSENGRELAGLLEERFAERDAELTILAHSMGGLVARSACHHAAEAGHAWPRRLDKIVFLGTPHHGAPLERGGRWLELLLGVSPYSAPLARLGMVRGAGITDLRHGVSTPLPAGVTCHALAGTRDVLVPVTSALGRHTDPERRLAFPEAHCWVGRGVGHFDLLHDPEVYARLRAIMTPAAPPRGRRTRAGA